MSTAALLALAVVGLSGCMKVDADLTLQSDDTIDGTMLMAYTNEMAITLDVTPDSVIETMQFAPEDTSPGETVTVEPYEDDAYMGGTLIFDGSPLDRFADEESGTPGLTITREGDEFVVSGTIDLTEETNGDFEETYGTLLDGYDAQVSITFPGPVTEHTGDLSGNTVTWEPQIGESLDVSARGSAVPVATSDDQSDGSGAQGDSTTNEDASEGLSTPLMIGIGAGALLLIGLVLFLILHSRKSGQTGGYPGQGYGYPGQECAPQGQGYAGPPQGYAPPQQGYAPPQQSYAPPPQQAPPQGYVPPPAPPQGYGYPAQPPHQGGWPPQGPPGGPPLR